MVAVLRALAPIVGHVSYDEQCVRAGASGADVGGSGYNYRHDGSMLKDFDALYSQLDN